MQSLCIVGATATGKTALAVRIATDCWERSLVPGVLILSADSKQVFRGQDIVTGKDIPTGFVWDQEVGAYCSTTSACTLAGIDVVSPDQEWSVSHFERYARTWIERATKAGQLVIVVGGTGLYVQSLLAPLASVHIPQNPDLRAQLEHASVSTLQSMLTSLDASRYHRMNDSDRQNPRRLVRAIEIAQAPVSPVSEGPALVDPYILGIQATRDELQQRIHARVAGRLAKGAIAEAIRLRSLPSWSKEASATLGYAEIFGYLDGQYDEDTLINLWTLHELQYAKRQRVWFARMQEIHWITRHEADELSLGELLNGWYTTAA